MDRTASLGLPLIVAPDAPNLTDRAAILAGLAGYNETHHPPGYMPVAVLLRDAQGETIGGLWGSVLYDWLVVELLYVPAALRGQDLGTELIHRAEAIGVERGCLGLWLDTFGFQARGFYEKLGYELFGTIDDHPRGNARFFMRKRLAAPAA